MRSHTDSTPAGMTTPAAPTTPGPSAATLKEHHMLDTIDRGQGVRTPLRRPAMAAGLGLLMMTVLAGAANLLVVEGLITADNPSQTAADILASEGVFRLGTAALLIVAILDVLVAWGLTEFLTPVDEGLSRLAAWLRIGYAAVFAVGVAQLVGVPRVLADAQDALGDDAAPMQSDALANVVAFQDIWGIALAIFGFHLILVGYLAAGSGYVPRMIGILVMVAGIGYIVDSLSTLLLADYALPVAAATFIGEVVLMLWLLARGRTVVLDSVA